jgi:hypothetical protein
MEAAMVRRAWTIVCALLILISAGPARAGGDVDVALVLVADVSRSINDHEYELQKHGYFAAFTSDQVINAIRGGPLGEIAVAYVEFAGGNEVATVLDWAVIRDRASAEAFAARLRQAPRSYWGRTAIGSGIDRGVQLLAESGYNAMRRVIDVCGDGINNSGREVTEARDDAVGQGIIINALAIINDNPYPWAQAHVNPPGGLLNYFRENVIGGPGAFALEVREFAKFGEAMTRKLVLEIAGRPVDGPRFAAFDGPGGMGGSFAIVRLVPGNPPHAAP